MPVETVVPTEADRRAYTQFEKRATEKLKDPSYEYNLEPAALNLIGEAVENQLAAAAEKDDSPDLFVVDDVKGARWPGLLRVALGAAYVAGASARPTPVPSGTTSLTKALEGLDEERRRLTTAINGNGSDSLRAEALRQRVFGAREVVRSRAGYESEYTQIITTLSAMKDPPAALTRMIPRLKSALAVLEGLPPVGPGRPVKTPESVDSFPVRLAAVALHLLLGDLLSHAATTASPARMTSLQKIVMGRRRSDGGERREEDAKKEAEKKATEKKATEKKATEKPVAGPPVEGAPGPVASGGVVAPASAEAAGGATSVAEVPAQAGAGKAKEI